MMAFELAGMLYFTVGVIAAIILVYPYKPLFLLRLGVTILFWPFLVFIIIILKRDGLWNKLGWW